MRGKMKSDGSVIGALQIDDVYGKALPARGYRIWATQGHRPCWLDYGPNQGNRPKMELTDAEIDVFLSRMAP